VAKIRHLSLPQSADFLGSGPISKVSDSTLMFAISSCRHTYILRLSSKLFSAAAAEQGRRHDHETTVDHALMRGLVTAGPVMRRGASSV